MCVFNRSITHWDFLPKSVIIKECMILSFSQFLWRHVHLFICIKFLLCLYICIALYLIYNLFHFCIIYTDACARLLHQSYNEWKGKANNTVLKSACCLLIYKEYTLKLSMSVHINNIPCAHTTTQVLYPFK